LGGWGAPGAGQPEGCNRVAHTPEGMLGDTSSRRHGFLEDIRTFLIKATCKYTEKGKKKKEKKKLLGTYH